MSRRPTFQTQVIRAGPSAALVQVRGDVDLTTSRALERVLTEAVHRERVVVIDARAVSFMDCAGLRALLAASREAQAQARHTRLALEGVQAPVALVLHLAGTEALLPARASSPTGRRLRKRANTSQRTTARRHLAPLRLINLGRGCADAPESPVAQDEAARVGARGRTEVP